MEFYDTANAEAAEEWIGAQRQPVIRIELLDTDTDHTREVVLSVDAAAELSDAIALVLDEDVAA
jgi:hypothetical protein